MYKQRISQLFVLLLEVVLFIKWPFRVLSRLWGWNSPFGGCSVLPPKQWWKHHFFFISSCLYKASLRSCLFSRGKQRIGKSSAAMYFFWNQEHGVNMQGKHLTYLSCGNTSVALLALFPFLSLQITEMSIEQKSYWFQCKKRSSLSWKVWLVHIYIIIMSL